MEKEQENLEENQIPKNKKVMQKKKLKMKVL